jgi:uncharacterized membrane protein YGL010W
MEFLSPFFQTLFQQYAEAHRDPRNRLTHLVGIPLIVFSLLGLVGRIPSPVPFHWDIFLWAVASLFYFKHAGWMALPFVLSLLLLCVLARFVGIHTHWTLFVLGWVAQIVGHYVFEKKAPSFLDNLIQMLIGPFWIYCYLAKRLPFYSDLFSKNGMG